MKPVIAPASRGFGGHQILPAGASGVGQAEDGTPRFVVLAERVRLVDMTGAAGLAGYKSRDMVPRLIERDGFPLPVIGGNGADYRWRVSDIDAWVAALPHVPLRSPSRSAA